jgi:hypothetical protein
MTENYLYCERTLPRNDLLENGADRRVDPLGDRRRP